MKPPFKKADKVITYAAYLPNVKSKSLEQLTNKNQRSIIIQIHTTNYLLGNDVILTKKHQSILTIIALVLILLTCGRALVY